MKLFPAIDLRGGRVVRLQQGNFDLMTVYSDDPVDTAKGFLYAGAIACTWWTWTALRTAARRTVQPSARCANCRWRSKSAAAFAAKARSRMC